MKQAEFIDYYKSKLSKIESLEEYKDLKLLAGEIEIKGELKPYLAIWKGRQKKPFWAYWSHTDEMLIKNALRLMGHADTRAKEKAAKKKETPEFEVGDIFVASWGYEQTNVDAFEVIEKPSKHYAIFKKIATERIPGTEGYDCCNVKPVPGAYLDYEPFRKKVIGKRMHWRSYANAYKWDGKKTYYNSWYY